MWLYIYLLISLFQLRSEDPLGHLLILRTCIRVWLTVHSMLTWCNLREWNTCGCLGILTRKEFRDSSGIITFLNNWPVFKNGAVISENTFMIHEFDTINFTYLFNCLFVYLCVYICHTLCAMVRKQLVRVDSFPLLSGPWDTTQVIRLDTKCLHCLSYLSCPIIST